MAEIKKLFTLFDESGNKLLGKSDEIFDKASGKTVAEHIADASIHTPKATIDAERTSAINLLKDGTTDGSGGLSADYDNLLKISNIVAGLKSSVEAFLTGEDDNNGTIDRLVELVAAINENKGTIEQLTSGKVNVADIVDSLTSTETGKPLSANQGRVLKEALDALSQSVESAIANVHTHSNKAVLDGISASETSGNMVYNGVELTGQTGLAIGASLEAATVYNGKMRVVVEDYTVPTA